MRVLLAGQLGPVGAWESRVARNTCVVRSARASSYAGRYVSPEPPGGPTGPSGGLPGLPSAYGSGSSYDS
ncbi:hypothetical protein [Streptomyces sp. LN325]|uniref:hypothetical protein n=1 Tax=Streptomyces sp. LN325 TaxID=3112976 RepID=UPI0037202FA3